MCWKAASGLQDDNLRVNVELINPVTRLSVWSGRVERSGADRQGVRDEIVSRLARELQFEVLPIESQRLSNDFDADALAYRGWAALSQVSLEGYKQALALFNQALERDPDNLSAQLGIGAYHARMGAQVFDTDPDGHRAKAEAILRQVLARDPEVRARRISIWRSHSTSCRPCRRRCSISSARSGSIPAMPARTPRSATA